jgi:hypothetical protein
MSEELQGYQADQLAELVEADKCRRVDEFRRIIEEAAARLRIQLVPVVTIAGQGVTSSIQIVAQ